MWEISIIKSLLPDITSFLEEKSLFSIINDSKQLANSVDINIRSQVHDNKLLNKERDLNSKIFK